MRWIEAWFHRHKILGNVLGAVVVIGGMWLLAGYFVSQAKPDTPSAHIYCSIIAVGPDGRFDPVKAGEELDISKKLAFEQGGQEGVRQAAEKAQRIAAEYQAHIEKGDVASIRDHYQDKCQGY